MITEYQVVYGHDIWIVQSKVNELLPDGWQPFNELQVATPVVEGRVVPFYAQVMVKTKNQ
jgi:hypothetical protein